MAFDTFVGLPLDQSIAGAAWDSGGMAWSAYTLLSGNGANAVKSTQVAPNQGLANYSSLDGQTGQAVFFKIAPGRATTAFAMALFIDSTGTHDQYAPASAVKASIGAYGALVIRDMAAAAEVSIACAIADDTEYCLELVKTTNASGMEYRATMYSASGGVRGAQIATQIISVATALPGTNKRVHLATDSSNHSLITINRVESVDGAVADTTAPVLSAPTATATTSSSATGTVATDKAGGTLYYLATANAAETAATIKATGGTQAVGATGTRTVYLTGLAPGALRYLHFVQTDGAATPNTSNVVSSAAFTTPAADTTAPTLTGSITPGAITASSLAFSYPAGTDNVAVTGYQISKDSGANWVDNGTGLSGSFTGLTASTTYQIWVRAYDNGATRNYSTPLQLAMTTSASPTGSITTDAMTSSGTLRASVACTYTWFLGGVIGTTTGTTTHGSGTTAAGGALTAAGLPKGAGYLMVKFADGGICYQPGTVA